LCRSLLSLFHGHVRSIVGLEHIRTDADPFLLVLNHSQRPEAILVPAWLCFHRGGRMVHFMADWNFLMIPGVGGIIRAHDPIVVTRKSARPAFLNRLKPRFTPELPPFEDAARRIRDGRSIGLFPEGTTNRHPTDLLQGYRGAAPLAVETGVRVIPGGIRFPQHRGDGPIQDRTPFSVEFGPALPQPPLRHGSGTSTEQIRNLHHEIMTAISTLSGKRWQARSRRTKYAFDED
jgi:1-acyl-sn-glycerol-3-phosphate acyltransferase